MIISSSTLTSEPPSVNHASSSPPPPPPIANAPPKLIGPAFVAWGEAPATSMITNRLADRRIGPPFFPGAAAASRRDRDNVASPRRKKMRDRSAGPRAYSPSPF